MGRAFVVGPSRRGLFALACLALAIVLAAGAALTLARRGDEGRACAPPASALDRARTAYAEGDLARAEEILREVLASAPGDRAAKLPFGRVLLGRGRLQAAREAFSAVLKEDKDNVEAVRGLAEVSEALGDLDAAAAGWRRAAALNSGSAEPRVRLARVLQKKNDFAGAMAALQQARSIDPKREDVDVLFQEVLAAQAAAPAGPPGFPHPGGVSMPPHPQVPNPRTSVPIPQPPDPLKGYPTGGIPR
jgi:tetratricopeptide (TPR) repeat protein